MSKKGIKIILGILLAIGMFSASSFLFAEMQINTQEEDIVVDLSPRSPEPYQNATISISSYSTDLNKATITWQGSSGVLQSGIGKTSYSFTATGPNTSMSITILIKPVGSLNSIKKTVTITPSEIDLLWEAIDGYVPPFYKGKVLPTKGGFIKTTAVPNTNTIKSKSGNISYIWKNNDEVVEDSSGYNKNSYVFKNDIYSNTNQITVDASSVNSNYNAEKTITIPSYDSSIIFYKKSPTEGVMYNKALIGEASFNEDEMTIVAEPYNMILSNSDNDYIWKINGEQISTPSKKTELTVRPTERGGYANISLTIENMKELFQKVAGQLKLKL